MTSSENIATTNSSNPDVVLIGAGIMSTTLAVILKELAPRLTIEIHEVLGSEAQESSNAWNNAGTGHAALCELDRASGYASFQSFFARVPVPPASDVCPQSASLGTKSNRALVRTEGSARFPRPSHR